MRVIVIHDRQPIGDEIRSACLDVLGAASNVDLAKDLLEARKLLAERFYDLAIVDLTLPIRHGRDASIENAEILFEEIFEGDELHAPADIIGISADPDAVSQISTSISEHLMTCLPEKEGWKAILRNKLAYLDRVRGARQAVANTSFDRDLVIITALDKEAEPYGDLFALSEAFDMKGARLFSFADALGTFRTGVLYAIGRAGQAPAAAATQALLTQFRPRLMIMTGFCGGVADRTSFGDLVGFTKIDAWDYGKWIEDEAGRAVFQPRPDTLVAPEGQMFDLLRDSEKSYVPDEQTKVAVAAASGSAITRWNIKGGQAGSGSAVVTSDDKMIAITGRNEDIRAIDMESYGFYHACSHTPVTIPDYMCLKSVADMCNGDKNSRFHSACSRIAASFVHDMVRTKYDFSR